MKYLKLFEDYSPELDDIIEKFCEDNYIQNYDILEDGSLYVRDDIIIYDPIEELPVVIKECEKSFIANDNQLTTLKGSPQKCEEFFISNNKNLTSLEGCGQDVTQFICSNCSLTNLIGGPKKVKTNYYCNDNELTSLEGIPNRIPGMLHISNNNIYTPDHFPQKVGRFSCEKNPIHEIYCLFDNYDQFMESLDHNYFLGGNEIHELAFEDALLDFGHKKPLKLINYKYV